MNIEETKKRIEIMKAFVEGKTIQMLWIHGDWHDVDTPSWDEDREYRIKQEVSYAPFLNTADLIETFIRKFNVKTVPYGEPFIWIKNKQADIRSLITSYDVDSVCVNGRYISMDELYHSYVFLDDSPVAAEIDTTHR